MEKGRMRKDFFEDGLKIQTRSAKKAIIIPAEKEGRYEKI
jgi:hypothetical protein